MIGHSAFADYEFLGDLTVALALRHQSQHICLTWAESGRQMWPGPFPSKLMQSLAHITLKCLVTNLLRQNQGLFQKDASGGHTRSLVLGQFKVRLGQQSKSQFHPERGAPGGLLCRRQLHSSCRKISQQWARPPSKGTSENACI